MKRKIVSLCLVALSLFPHFCACRGEGEPIPTTGGETEEETLTEKISFPPLWEEVQRAPSDELTEEKLSALSAAFTEKLSSEAISALPLASAAMTKEELRALCLAFFELQISFQWTPSQTVTDWPGTYTTAKKTLDVGTVYGGIPYQSHGSGNLYRFLEYYDDETGVFDVETAFRENGGDAKTEIKTDSAGNITYYKRYCQMILFNQCSGSAFWGWGRVINSVNFHYTAYMTVRNGFIPVGDFTYGYDDKGKHYGPETIDAFGKKTEGNPKGYDVDDLIADWRSLKGSNAMYECYAQIQPADLLVSTGHTRMAKSVHVERNAAGSIDPAKSYVVALDQNESWGKNGKLGSVPYKVQGGVNKKYSFKTLQSGNYIPYTFAEFLEEGDPRLETFSSSLSERYDVLWEAVKDSVGVGVEKAEVFCTLGEAETVSLKEFSEASVASNYAVSDVFVRVGDREGRVVAKNIYRAPDTTVREVKMTAQRSTWGEGETLCMDLEDFCGADYSVEISLQLSTGEKLVAWRGVLTAE